MNPDLVPHALVQAAYDAISRIRSIHGPISRRKQIAITIATALPVALDRQKIARSLYEHHAQAVEWRDGVALAPWGDVPQETGEHYLEQADGIITAILGDPTDDDAGPWAPILNGAS